MDLVSEGISLLSGYTVTLLGDTWYGNLISQGVINGVGSVLVFFTANFNTFSPTRFVRRFRLPCPWCNAY